MIGRLDQPTRLTLGMVESRTARFRFARQDQGSSTTSIRLNFRMARDPPRIRNRPGRERYGGYVNYPLQSSLAIAPAARLIPRLLQLGALRLGFFQDGNVGVGVFP
jgi:hypothetical protein